MILPSTPAYTRSAYRSVPVPVPVMRRSSLDRAAGHAVDDIALERHEHAEHRKDEDQGAGHHGPEFGREGAVHRQEPQRDRLVGRIVQEGRGDEEVVPGTEAHDDPYGDQPRAYHRQQHPPDQLEDAGAVDQGRLLQFLGHVEEEGAHQERREGHVDGGEDDADHVDVVEQSQLGDAGVQREDEQLDGHGHGHRQIDHDRGPDPDLLPGQHIAGQGRADQDHHDRGAGQQDAVDEAGGEVAVLPGGAEVGPRERLRQRERVGGDFGVGFEAVDEDQQQRDQRGGGEHQEHEVGGGALENGLHEDSCLLLIQV